MKYIIANWKMNLNLEAITLWLQDFGKSLPQPSEDLEIILTPSFLHLPLVSLFAASHPGVKTAAQDVSAYGKGAHTGETGAFQIKDFGSYCIVGHSERNEPKDIVGQKINKCLELGIIPIACFINPQEAVSIYKPGVLLAWEDPKNISKDGQYNASSPETIRAAVTQIKSALPAESVVIYGGSVNRQNAQDLANIYELGGVLVGNASNDPAHFSEIIKAF